jgi:spermidine synthase
VLAVFIATYGVLPLVLIGPPTVMMGLSFGLLQRAVQTDVHLLGRRVGWLQTANVAGATIGAVLTGLVLLDLIGTVGTLRLLACTSIVYFWLHALSSPSRTARRVLGAAALAGIVSVALPPAPTFWARLHAARPAVVLQREDGSGLALLKVGRAQTVVFANGIGQSHVPYGGAHTALGALPVLLHPEPRTVAVIGLGSGDTLFAAGGRRETTTIDNIEIIEGQVETLHDLASRMAYPALRMLLADPRITFHSTDGRAFIRKGGRRYDIIEADALRPTSAFAGNLFSVEYFRMLREHLEPGGYAVSWVPTPRVRDSMLQAFPYVTTIQDVGIGSEAPIDASSDRIRRRLVEPFTARYYEQGLLDIAYLLRDYVAVTPHVIGPEQDRSRLQDVNRDLFPKDEFALPYTPFEAP